MEAGKHDLEINQGAQFRIELELVDENDAPTNLTGFTARMKIKHAVTEALIISLTTTANANGDKLTLGGAAGTVEIFISTASTNGMDFVEGKYDLELVDSLGEVDRLIEGKVLFNDQVSD